MMGVPNWGKISAFIRVIASQEVRATPKMTIRIVMGRRMAT
jgi:hypothetical protein